ncbi:MAG TPA: hypothetical protein VK922_04090 [Gemmatimonadaceae bacterium]|nr:hypothetical protein [Gemmatimonadaceae bacterium]
MNAAGGGLLPRWHRAPAAAGGRSFIVGLVLTSCLASGAIAQVPAPSLHGVSRVVEGRVAKPAGDTLRGVEGVWVVLHRVGADTAGPVDSVRTSPQGAYRIPFRQVVDDRTIYFVSAQYADIAYFSPPLPDAPSEDDAEIIVYDTASSGIPVRIHGRHLVLSGADADGMRDVVEIYEIANETDRTLVSPDDVQPTWRGRLPAQATGIRIGEGDVAEEAVRVAGDTLDVFAPIAPGLKSFSLAYRLPASAFPLRVPVDSSVALFEVLLEDPAIHVEGAGLAPGQPANVEGRMFRRFSADSVAAGSVIRASVVALGQSRRSLYVAVVLIAFGAAMLVAIARTFARRGSVAAPVGSPMPPVPRSADALAREIAALDAEFERKPPQDREMREAYTARRAALKDALARALAAEGTRK